MQSVREDLQNRNWLYRRYRIFRAFHAQAKPVFLATPQYAYEQQPNQIFFPKGNIYYFMYYILREDYWHDRSYACTGSNRKTCNCISSAESSNETRGGWITPLSLLGLENYAVSLSWPHSFLLVQELCPLSANTASKLDILGHDSHTLGVNSAQVGILKETNKVCFGCFLQSKNRRRLEAKVGLEILSNFTDKALERCLTNEKVSRLLVLSDFTKGDSSGAVPVWLLHSSGSRSWLTRRLNSQRDIHQWVKTGSQKSGRKNWWEK